ncbi:MAG: polyprenyl diphosphate synthase [Spirochaetia bacterium]
MNTVPGSSDQIENLPTHIGIIMDGNGRWARERGFPRSKGHKEGLSTVKRIVQAAHDKGIPYLSVYAFSTENWKRAEEEISYLMFLVKTYLKREYEFYKQNNVRIMHSGDISKLPKDVQEVISEVEEHTRQYSGITVNIALNYGGRNEIVRAMNKWMHGQNNTEKEITEDDICKHLDTGCLPDPDLIIRTAGEQRLSNFLIWQAAYAELYFSDTLWPEWTEEDFEKALDNFSKRIRKFGGVKNG